MDVNFTSKNGMCPYFEYENTKFFIQDEKQEDKNEYKYYLVEQDQRKKSEKFDSTKEAIDHIFKIEKVRIIWRAYSGELWRGAWDDYLIKQMDSGKVMLTVRKSNIIISDKFDSYGECLDFSKALIEKRLSKLGQVSMFTEFETNAYSRTIK